MTASAKARSKVTAPETPPPQTTAPSSTQQPTSPNPARAPTSTHRNRCACSKQCLLREENHPHGVPSAGAATATPISSALRHGAQGTSSVVTRPSRGMRLPRKLDHEAPAPFPPPPAPPLPPARPTAPADRSVRIIIILRLLRRSSPGDTQAISSMTSATAMSHRGRILRPRCLRRRICLPRLRTVILLRRRMRMRAGIMSAGGMIACITSRQGGTRVGRVGLRVRSGRGEGKRRGRGMEMREGSRVLVAGDMLRRKRRGVRLGSVLEGK